MQYTSLPPYIYLSPRRETWAEWCYCINIGKVKTWWCDAPRVTGSSGAGNAGTRAECKACFVVRDPTSLRNKQHWGWMRNKADLSGSNAQGEYIFSEKTERERKGERVQERSVLKCILRQNGRKSTELWGDYLTIWQNYLKKCLAVVNDDLQTQKQIRSNRILHIIVLPQ